MVLFRGCVVRGEKVVSVLFSMSTYCCVGTHFGGWKLCFPVKVVYCLFSVKGRTPGKVLAVARG